jgi:DNA recombination protein RmuC
MRKGREQMRAQFDALAGQVIRTHGEDFRKAATEQLGAIVAPLASDIGKFQSEIRSAHQGALAERAALKEQLGTLTRRSEAVSREAESLTRALRGDTQMQGAWGEAVLGRLLETSGLREGYEYETQTSAKTEGGKILRPDVIVHLPGGRDMVIDSKVSLVAYERAVNTEDEAVHASAIADHVASLRAHVKGLSAKEYAAVTGGTADYVILFVPIEGALSEALRARPDLTEYAAALQVMIATPTTLMMALRTVKTVWDVENRNANAEKIAARAGALYDKVVGFATDMERVGKQIDAARDAHAAAVAKLTDGNGNVIRQVEMLKTLGAKTVKSMPASMGIDAANVEETSAEPD